LNKIDLFAEKLSYSRLGDYFPDFNGGDNYDLACDYLLHRFVSLNQSRRRNKSTHIILAQPTHNRLSVRTFPSYSCPNVDGLFTSRIERDPGHPPTTAPARMRFALITSTLPIQSPFHAQFRRWRRIRHKQLQSVTLSSYLSAVIPFTTPAHVSQSFRHPRMTGHHSCLPLGSLIGSLIKYIPYHTSDSDLSLSVLVRISPTPQPATSAPYAPPNPWLYLFSMVAVAMRNYALFQWFSVCREADRSPVCGRSRR
jgi:hypothetical protein